MATAKEVKKSSKKSVVKTSVKSNSNNKKTKGTAVPKEPPKQYIWD